MRESLIEKGVIITEQIQGSFMAPPPEPAMQPMESGIDRDELIDQIADTLWEDSLYSMVEEGKMDGWIPQEQNTESIVDQFKDNRPSSVDREAGDFLNALEGFAGSDIETIAADLGTDDIEALGYYIPMQMMGHGVSWSDSREGDLDTPYKESTEARMEAEEAIRAAFGAGTPEDWDLNR